MQPCCTRLVQAAITHSQVRPLSRIRRGNRGSREYHCQQMACKLSAWLLTDASCTHEQIVCAALPSREKQEAHLGKRARAQDALDLVKLPGGMVLPVPPGQHVVRLLVRILQPCKALPHCALLPGRLSTCRLSCRPFHRKTGNLFQECALNTERKKARGLVSRGYVHRYVAAGGKLLPGAHSTPI